MIKGPRSLVHEKTPNGGKTEASGKTATGSLTRSKVKTQRSEVAKSKVGLNDIIYTRVSSSKQADKAGFKRQQERCEVTAGKRKTVKEVVSGSLPATDRTQLVRKSSSRTPARSLDAKSRENNRMNCKKRSPDCFRGAVATWAGKGKSKKQVTHTIRGHQSPRFKDNPGASEAKPCYYQGDSQHCQEDLEPMGDLGLPVAVAQPPKPAPPGECCPRLSTRPEWQCDSPWSEVA